MSGSAPVPPHVDNAILIRLKEKVEMARQTFENAPDREKTKALLQLDRAVNNLTDALLYGKIPTE